MCAPGPACLPDIPPDGDVLWQWFWELSSARASSGYGPQPVGWADMAAWARLTGIDLAPWQALALRRMDETYLKTCADMQARDKGYPHDKHVRDSRHRYHG